MKSTWFAYECLNGCGNDIPGDDGVVLDLRSTTDTPPGVDCPRCGKPMDFRGYWPADDRGYGSRADFGSMANYQPPLPEDEVDRLRCAALAALDTHDAASWINFARTVCFRVGGASADFVEWASPERVHKLIHEVDTWRQLAFHPSRRAEHEVAQSAAWRAP